MNLADFTPPLKTFFTVPSTYDPRTLGNATAALAGLEVYASPAIPGWSPSILVAGMTSGVIYRLPLSATLLLPSPISKHKIATATSPLRRMVGGSTSSRMRTVGP